MAASLPELREHIVTANYSQAADSFCRLIKDGHPVNALVREAIDATAPFVQAPSHIMPKGDGTWRGVNYDHTILGWRASLRMMPAIGGAGKLLPVAQAMWYVPQGLDVWSQVQCDFPGHYARDQEKCDTRDQNAPSAERLQNAGPTGTNFVYGGKFDRPSWRMPSVHFEDHPPLLDGSVEERLARMQHTIWQGERVESYRLFIGLAQDPEARPKLKEAILLAGITDLQETIIQRGAFQNIGHKALRARAMVDLADALGWENAHGVFYTVVPDLGCFPRFYEIWSLVNTIMPMEFRNWATLKHDNQMPLSEHDLDRLIDTVNWGKPGDVVALLTELLRGGRAVQSIADGLVIAYVHNELQVMEHPVSFFTPGHAYDYTNVVNHFLRTYDSPHAAKVLYFAALFINDVLRANQMFPRDPAFALESPQVHAATVATKSTGELLELAEAAIDAMDAPLTMAAVNEYLDRTGEREALIARLAYAGSKIQNDPHVERCCISSMEEYRHNSTSRKDDILRGWAKYLARAVRRSTEQGCYQLFQHHFVS